VTQTLDLVQINQILYKAGSEHVGEVEAALRVIARKIQASGHKLTDVKLVWNDTTNKVSVVIDSMSNAERVKRDELTDLQQQRIDALVQQRDSLLERLAGFESQRSAGRRQRVRKPKREPKHKGFSPNEIEQLLSELPAGEPSLVVSDELVNLLNNSSFSKIKSTMRGSAYKRHSERMRKGELDTFLEPFRKLNRDFEVDFRRLFLNMTEKTFENMLTAEPGDSGEVELGRAVVFCLRADLLRKRLKGEPFTAQGRLL
jgi:hypothetical protein